MKRDFRKEYEKNKWRCIKCKGAWVPDARHVSDLGMEDCRPDNLTYLEVLLDKKERLNGKS